MSDHEQLTHEQRPQVSFGAAIVSVVRQYARFDGRARPAEFWWWALFSTLVASALGVIDQAVTSPASATGTGTLTNLWVIATLVPWLAVSVRRLRDGGNSWTQLFWVLVPIAGLIVLILRFIDPSVPAHDERSPSGQVPARRDQDDDH